MKLVRLECPVCGAAVEITEGDQITECHYCGSSLYVDSDGDTDQPGSSQNLGYAYEMGRIKAQREAAEQERLEQLRAVEEYRRHLKMKTTEFGGLGFLTGIIFGAFLVQRGIVASSIGAVFLGIFLICVGIAFLRIKKPFYIPDKTDRRFKQKTTAVGWLGFVFFVLAGILLLIHGKELGTSHIIVGVIFIIIGVACLLVKKTVYVGETGTSFSIRTDTANIHQADMEEKSSEVRKKRIKLRVKR